MEKEIEIEVQQRYKVPSWAKYSACDANGDFCVFDEKPYICDEIVGEGIFDTDHNFILLAKNIVVKNWKESLIELQPTLN